MGLPVMMLWVPLLLLLSVVVVAVVVLLTVTARLGII